MAHKGRFVSPPIRLNADRRNWNVQRADIEIYGIDQSGPSFEGRVFLNNPGANLHTPTLPENGYAGSFHVYGYGIWPADIGKDPEAQKAAARETVRAPIDKFVVVTEAVRAAAERSEEVTVTVVPVYPGNPPRDAGDALKLDHVRIVLRQVLM